MSASPIKPTQFTRNTNVDVLFQNSNNVGVAVTDKISCVFQCELTEIASEKPGRSGMMQRLATNVFDERFEKCLSDETPNIFGKIDGTSAYVHPGKGLCFRRDIRIATEGKFAGQYVSAKNKPTTVPDEWVTLNERPDYKLAKGKWAHHIGFMPISLETPKHMNEVYDAATKELYVLDTIQHVNGDEETFTFKWISIKDCIGKSFEMVGPKIQSDPHGIGRHCLVSHTSSAIQVYLESFDQKSIKDFLVTHPNLEGLVFHFPKNQMAFKIHRLHLGMKWKH